MSRWSQRADANHSRLVDPAILHLSQLLGAPARRRAAILGRVADLGARPARDRWPLAAVRLRDGTIVEAPVVAVEGGALELGDDDRDPGSASLVWLGRRVLDRRVIDIDGRRVVRVGDVALERSPTGLEVIAIELGVAPLLRRVGLGRLAAHVAPVLVPLDAAHLPRSPRDAIELTTTAARLSGLAAHDLAEILSRLTVPEAGAVLADLPAADAARVLGALHPEHAADVLASADPDATAPIVEALPTGHVLRHLHRHGRAPRRLTRRRFLHRRPRG